MCLGRFHLRQGGQGQGVERVGLSGKSKLFGRRGDGQMGIRISGRRRYQEISPRQPQSK